MLNDEVQFEKSLKELKIKLAEKDNENCNLKQEHSITKDQLQTMIEKYQVCKKELESTQITCEKWVESCKGYEVMLENRLKAMKNLVLVLENMMKLKTMLQKNLFNPLLKLFPQTRMAKRLK